MLGSECIYGRLSSVQWEPNTFRSLFGRVLAAPAVLPLALAATSLTVVGYARIAGNEISTERVPVLLALAHIALALTTLSFGLAVASSFYRLALQARASQHSGKRRILAVLGEPFVDPRSRRRYLGIFLLYYVVFPGATGVIVIRPGQNFTETYGVPVPSAQVLLCCGEPGSIPSYVLYLAQGFGLLVYPTNLLLSLSVSLLASLSIALSVQALAARQSAARSVSGPGFAGITGFLASCPTCAGQVILAGVLGAGSVAVATALTPWQLYLGMASIGILFAALYQQGRSIAAGRRSCSVGTSRA